MGSDVLKEDSDILIVSELCLGKKSKKDDFPSQKRGGKGRKIYKITPKTGNIAGINQVKHDDEVMLINSAGS